MPCVPSAACQVFDGGMGPAVEVLAFGLEAGGDLAQGVEHVVPSAGRPGLGLTQGLQRPPSVQAAGGEVGGRAEDGVSLGQPIAPRVARGCGRNSSSSSFF